MTTATIETDELLEILTTMIINDIQYTYENKDDQLVKRGMRFNE